MASLSTILFSAEAPSGAVFIDTSTRRITFGDFRADAARFASALLLLGLRKGDRVLVQTEKSVETVALYGACVLAGVVFIPMNTSYTLSELERFVADADPALVVCDPSRLDALRERLSGSVRVESLAEDGSGTFTDLASGASPQFDPVACEPDDLAAILYTSGTTGRSKGAMLTHNNLLSNAQSLVEAWRFTSSDVLLHALPIYHTHGLFVATNVALLAGARMIFLPKFDLEAVKAALPQCTTMMGVPTYYTRLLSDGWVSRQTVGHMRLFISGSAPLLRETHEQFAERTGHHILERYGMTETGMNTSNPYDGDRRAGTVGFPLPGVEMRIAAAPGEIGMIELRGPNVFAGYWRDPVKTAEEFTEDGFFRTGDLGQLDADGYLQIVGRGKDLIISGGLNVYPKEVELTLNGVAGVADSAVIGVPHPDLGEGVVAVVVPERGVALDAQTILSTIRAELAGFKLPKRIVIVDDLPRNAMGKVQKNLLRDRYAALLD